MFEHWLNHFKMEGGALWKLPLGEMPAQGRRAGLRTAHTFVETLCRKSRILCVAEVISPSAFH